MTGGWTTVGVRIEGDGPWIDAASGTKASARMLCSRCSWAGVSGALIPVEDLPPLSCWADDRMERRVGWSLVAAVDLRAEDKRLASVAVLPVVDRLRAFNSSIRASLASDDELFTSGSSVTAS